jgi:hypothetical protein
MKYRALVSITLLFLLFNQGVQAQDSLVSAESSFKYIATTLDKFRATGRLVNNPGIDGADLEHFIALLDDFYQQFSQGFNSDSAMCQFYRDPENGRMTIEQRAELSFSYLREIGARLERYISIDEDFQLALEEQFGSILLRNITAAKATAISNQRLPSSNFDEAAMINFADTMCD